MEIESDYLWSNEAYERAYMELKEKYESLAMDIPKSELKRLPKEYLSAKITFDPLQVMPFAMSEHNPGWTRICICGEWYLVDITYEQMKGFIEEAEKEGDLIIENEEEETESIPSSAEET